MTAFSIEKLTSDAREIRRAFLKMHYEAKAGHLGSGPYIARIEDEQLVLAALVE